MGPALFCLGNYRLMDVVDYRNWCSADNGRKLADMMHSSADIPKILADIIGNSADNSQYLAGNPETPIPSYLERIYKKQRLQNFETFPGPIRK